MCTTACLYDERFVSNTCIIPTNLVTTRSWQCLLNLCSFGTTNHHSCISTPARVHHTGGVPACSLAHAAPLKSLTHSQCPSFPSTPVCVHHTGGVPACSLAHVAPLKSVAHSHCSHSQCSPILSSPITTLQLPMLKLKIS